MKKLNKKKNIHLSCSYLLRTSRNWIPGTSPRMTQYQQGRSMVEMLGVLAIIGVLSVGGVAMYTNAMNKYRANDILNEASKRAVMVAGQLLTNPSATTMPLSQFGSNTVAGATFKNDAAISNGKITLTFETAPDEAICNQMIAATGTNSAMQVPTGCGTITFNTDMSKGDTSSGGSEGNTTCPAGTADTGAGGYAATLSDGTMCYCETSGTTYQSGSCQTKPESCTSYADCDKGEYCQFSPNSCETAPTSGTCQPVSAGNLYSIGTNYKASDYGDGCSPDWWTTKDICASLGMHMPSLTEVGCEDYKNSTCPTTGTVYGQLKNDADNPLSYGFWTTDMYDSCGAWYVYGGAIGIVASNGRNGSIDFLCVR